MNAVSTNATEMDVVSCMDVSYITFSLSPEFVNLETLLIYEKNFPFAFTFNVTGLPSLKVIAIGENSFTLNPYSFGRDFSRSFHLTNCPELTRFVALSYSFSDYSGEVEFSSIDNGLITSRFT